jgi:hypothetical protein
MLTSPGAALSNFSVPADIVLKLPEPIILRA